MPRMACSLTIDQVRDRTKTVTRRHTYTWVGLRPGDRLTLIEKGMGLKKGERQVVLAEVEVVSNQRVLLAEMDQAECDREGFPHLTPAEFIAMWVASHKVRPDDVDGLEVRRIEWRYLD